MERGARMHVVRLFSRLSPKAVRRLAMKLDIALAETSGTVPTLQNAIKDQEMARSRDIFIREYVSRIPADHRVIYATAIIDAFDVCKKKNHYLPIDLCWLAARDYRNGLIELTEAGEVHAYSYEEHFARLRPIICGSSGEIGAPA